MTVMNAYGYRGLESGLLPFFFSSSFTFNTISLVIIIDLKIGRALVFK